MDCTRNPKDGRECVCVVCVTHKEVEGSRSDTKQDILRKKRGVQALELAVENINLSAEKAVERSDEIFNDLIRHMEKRSSDLKQKVRAEQEFKVSRVKALQEKLEQEISELKKHAQELDALQEEYSSEPLQGSAGPTSSHMCPLRFVEDVKATVSSEPLRGSAGPTSSHMCPLRVLEDVKATISSEPPRGSAGPTSSHMCPLRVLEDVKATISSEPLRGSAGPTSSHMCPLRVLEDVKATVSDTKDKPLCGLKPRDVPADCRTNRLKPPVPQTQADDPPVATEPKSRAEFLRYARDVTLDPNTVNTQLLLSEGNRKATLTMREERTYPRHADRFVRWRQVLSAESLSGRCYWEVEWRKKRVNLAVSYRSIGRAGSMNECAFGFNNKSWLLECNCSSSYKFIHNGVKTLISGPRSSRVGVYLDHRAGILSFYSISETMTLLHRVQTTFTQPLHAGLWFSGYNGASAEFCKLT